MVACNRNPSTDLVVALDTWNGQIYSNDVDTIQDVEQFSSSYSAGRISCRYIVERTTVVVVCMNDTVIHTIQCCQENSTIR